MTSSVHRSDKSRHLLLRIGAGAAIPEALTASLRDEGVSAGWLRGSGVLTDVELRAYDAPLGTLGSAWRIEGPVQAVVLEGSVGVSGGEPSVSLRAVIARHSDRGLETLAGEIGSARVVALEAFVTALDAAPIERSLDPAAGVWLVGVGGGVPADRPSAGGAGSAIAHRGPPSTAWSAALEASDRPEREPSRGGAGGGTTGTGGGTAMPVRPPRAGPDLDTPFPEPGDSVDHFAFGRSDVVKSDGDRLHLKVHKDGRIREIAVGMLRVSRLPDDENGRRRFKLERKM